jgi:hypothetical protein
LLVQSFKIVQQLLPAESIRQFHIPRCTPTDERIANILLRRHESSRYTYLVQEVRPVDEFVVVVKSPDAESLGKRIAAACLTAFKTPIEVPGSLLIGINARPLQWVLTAEAALPMREHYTKMNAKIAQWCLLPFAVCCCCCVLSKKKSKPNTQFQLKYPS